MKAYCLIREQPWYRRDAFIEGLRAAGHSVETRWPLAYDRDTLLLIWNRYGEWHECASKVERAGGRVLVAENGYLGVGGTSPKFNVHPRGPTAEDYYALSRKYHNSRDENTPTGNQSRFDVLRAVLKPWCLSGGEVLILPNRSFGVPGRAMPMSWPAEAFKRISKQTKLPVRVRPHPGNNAPKTPLSADLARARCVVVWNSTAGIHALLNGIPTFCEATDWVMYDARARGTYDNPEVVEREPYFNGLAFAQWTITEIRTGEPFIRLLSGDCLPPAR